MEPVPGWPEVRQPRQGVMLRPVLGRLEERSFCLDPRTILPEDLPRLTALLKRLLAG